MRDPFLCPDCQKLGYCRKYKTKKLERTFDESERTFFEMVNKPAKIVDQENPVVPVKLISLEKIRAQFRNQDDITRSTSINIGSQTLRPKKHLNKTANIFSKLILRSQLIYGIPASTCS